VGVGSQYRESGEQMRVCSTKRRTTKNSKFAHDYKVSQRTGILSGWNADAWGKKKSAISKRIEFDGRSSVGGRSFWLDLEGKEHRTRRARSRCKVRRNMDAGDALGRSEA